MLDRGVNPRVMQGVPRVQGHIDHARDIHGVKSDVVKAVADGADEALRGDGVKDREEVFFVGINTIY